MNRSKSKQVEIGSLSLPFSLSLALSLFLTIYFIMILFSAGEYPLDYQEPSNVQMQAPHNHEDSLDDDEDEIFIGAVGIKECQKRVETIKSQVNVFVYMCTCMYVCVRLCEFIPLCFCTPYIHTNSLSIYASVYFYTSAYLSIYISIQFQRLLGPKGTDILTQLPDDLAARMIDNTSADINRRIQKSADTYRCRPHHCVAIY